MEKRYSTKFPKGTWLSSENDVRNKLKMLRKIYKSNKLVRSVLGKMPYSSIFHRRKNSLLFPLTGVFEREKGGTASDPTFLVARRGPARNKKKLKRRFFDFKQKKWARRKGTKASWLAIKNFNGVTGKHLNTSCFFYIRGFT